MEAFWEWLRTPASRWWLVAVVLFGGAVWLWTHWPEVRRGVRQLQRRLRGPVSPQQWIVDALGELRALGFFEDAGDLTSEQLLRRLRDDYEREFGSRLHLSWTDEYAEIELARLDRNRIWWDDLEADVGPGNDVYVRVLGEWASISRGAFQPTDITETWDGGQLRVSFRLGEAEVELRPAVHGDWLDAGIIKNVNHAIGDAGMRFEAPDIPLDQTLCLVVLTADEKRALRRRGWRFAR